MKLLIDLIALEAVLSLYSLFVMVVWNWASTEKPLNFWVAFAIVHLIRFIGLQFKKQNI